MNPLALACVLLLFALFALYRLHDARLSRQIERTLAARASERLRISRDLHDTLLQNFNAALIRMHTAATLCPTGEARRTLEKSIELASAALAEGRDAVLGLRTSARETKDLVDSIRTLGETLAGAHVEEQPVAFRVERLGEARPLHPIVRDEAFRIAAEALRNAFLHAHARHVRVEIRYEQRQLHITTCDDGRGIDPTLLGPVGRKGHFGLVGMRERARLLDGRLTVSSADQGGTEVALVVPGSIAYAERAIEDKVSVYA
jgi:signal transduction histidine kinase